MIYTTKQRDADPFLDALELSRELMNPMNPPPIIKVEGRAATQNTRIGFDVAPIDPCWNVEASGFASYEDYMAFAELAVRAAVHSQLDKGKA